MFPDFDCATRKWNITDPERNATRPQAHGRVHHMMAAHKRYAHNNGPYVPIDKGRNPVDVLMLKGALRPNPELRIFIDTMLASMQKNTSDPYMAFHARVEPDMQKHVMCKDRKERNLTKIFELVEKEFPEPPALKLFIPINRQYIEGEVRKQEKKPENETNLLAIDNLKALNRATKEGLWNGRVEVFEFGAGALAGTKFDRYPSTTGAMINFFLAINANVFIGTEVSSWSVDVVGTRFYRGNMQNYKYLPSGLELWTPEATSSPPNFDC